MEKLKRYDFITSYNDVRERNLKLIQDDEGPFIFDPDMELKPQESVSDPPTEPGWYWWKGEGASWRIVLIETNSFGDLGSHDIGLSWHWLKDLPLLESYEWQGPIKEPNKSSPLINQK